MTDEPIYAAERYELARSDLGGVQPSEALVEGYLSRPAAVVMVGSYSVGKTAVAMALAGSVATGTPFVGHAVKPARVLYVVGEGAWGLDQRLGAWEQTWHGGQAVGDDRLTFLVKPYPLHDSRAWADLGGYVVARGFGLVILDTLSSLAPELDETKDAARLLRWLTDLVARTGGTTLLVHHPGWSDSGRARGGYQLEANADEVLVLNGSQDTALISVTRKKVKDGPAGKVSWLRRITVGDSITVEHANTADVVAPLVERIEVVLDGMGEIGSSGKQLMDEIGVPDTQRSSFYRALRALAEDGRIDKRGNRGREVYTLKAPRSTP